MRLRRILLALLFLVPVQMGLRPSLAWALAHVDSGVLEAEDMEEIKESLTQTLSTIQTHLGILGQGRNLSDMSVGLFVSNLLGQLGRLDAPLSQHIHPNGGLIEEYLSNVFQYNAEQEIAAIADMDQPGNILARQTASAALECLTHIPNAKSPPDSQAEDRRDLAASLVQLNRLVTELRDGLP